MTTILYNKHFPRDSTVALRLSEDGSSLAVLMRSSPGCNWVEYTNVPLEVYRLFRPDHDAEFISDKGSVWEPKKG